jgi:hypothetical protein
MSEANDLRLEVYIRSMAHLVGMSEVKRILARVIPELEAELVDNPELAIAKKFSHSHKTKILS